jgi:hypothetical protein
MMNMVNDMGIADDTLERKDDTKKPMPIRAVFVRNTRSIKSTKSFAIT